MSMPVLKLRQVVGFPGNIVGGTGIEATKAHGTVTIDMQWDEFGAISAIPTSPTSFILTFDTATGAYVLVPSHLLGGAASGIADAPINGIQYGRQSGTWTVVEVETYADLLTVTAGAVTVTLRSKGYYVRGDFGGATYKRVTADPGHPGAFQTADSVWFEIAEPVLTPQMFGVVYGSDNSAAFQNCVTTAAKTSSKEVYVPGCPGFAFYRVENVTVPNVTAQSSITIRGAGRQTRIQPVSATSAYVFRTLQSGVIFSDIDFEGLPQTAGSIIQIGDVGETNFYSVVKNCIINNAFAGIHLKLANYVEISNNIILNYSLYGIYNSASSAPDGDTGEIYSNKLYTTGASAIGYYSLVPAGTRFHDNKVLGGFQCVRLDVNYDANVAGSEFEVRNNNLSGCTDTPLKIWHTGLGVLHHCLITGNLIGGGAGAGIEVFGNSSSDQFAFTINISNNIIRNTGTAAGIDLTAPVRFVIGGNIIDNASSAGTVGIQTGSSSDQVRVFGNLITNHSTPTNILGTNVNVTAQ